MHDKLIIDTQIYIEPLTIQKITNHTVKCNKCLKQCNILILTRVVVHNDESHCAHCALMFGICFYIFILNKRQTNKNNKLHLRCVCNTGPYSRCCTLLQPQVSPELPVWQPTARWTAAWGPSPFHTLHVETEQLLLQPTPTVCHSLLVSPHSQLDHSTLCYDARLGRRLGNSCMSATHIDTE